VPTLVWFNYRRVPAIAYAKRLIEQGKLGEIYQYRAAYLQSWGPRRDPSSTWRFDCSQAGSGAVGDLLSHLIDTAMMLNGPIAELCGMTHTFAHEREVDDAVFLQTRFRNGSVGTFEATRYAIGYQNRNRFEIHGSRGMIGFNLEDLDRLEFFDGSAEPPTQGISSILVTGPSHPHAPNFWPPGHIIGYEHTFIATLADFFDGSPQRSASSREFRGRFGGPPGARSSRRIFRRPRMDFPYRWRSRLRRAASLLRNAETKSIGLYH